ncbi:DUF3375 family protein [uncultured Leifsonia sp.]|uniref:DUF3375 family protein n=1 Tax=uncultured Leifsonia sp. TaxID=340359 RepID=UPI0025F30D60|nr:DUF3375 family protein [uncultured Leifsonia sp.]
MMDEALDGTRVAAVWEDHPTWALLRSYNGRWVLPLFSRHLEDTDGTVSADWFHQKVAEALEELEIDREPAEPDTTRTSPAEYCRSWVDSRWLVRTRAGAGEGRARYRLSQYSLQALRIVRELAEPDSAVSEARFASIAHAVHQLAALTDPSAESQLERLDREIAELQRRRDDIAEHGPSVAGPETVSRQVREVLRLTATLPEDFRQLGAMVEQRHRAVARAASSRTIGKGALVDRFLRDNDLLEQTPEGRAYRGFAAMLSSRELETMRADIERVLARPTGVAELTERQRTQLETLITSLLAEEQSVQETYVRWTSSLRRFLSRGGSDRHSRLLALAARAVDAGALWAERRPGPALVDGDVLGIGGWDLVDVTQAQLWRDRGRPEVGVAITENDDPLPADERDALRLAVGTSAAAVRETIDSLLSDAETVTGADVYAATPPEYRRLGLAVSLIELGAELGAVADGVQTVPLDVAAGAREVTMPLLVFGRDAADREADGL